MGKLFILLGIILLILGLILTLAPQLLSWFGRLPGDIRIEGERGSFFLPLTSMILVSLVLTLLINLLQR